MWKVWFAMTMVMVGSVSGALLLPPPCSPSVLEEVDNPKVTEICRFLRTYADAVEAHYASRRLQFLVPPLNDGGVKRHDVDHVFLRFGKRR